MLLLFEGNNSENVRNNYQFCKSNKVSFFWELKSVAEISMMSIFYDLTAYEFKNSHTGEANEMFVIQIL